LEDVAMKRVKGVVKNNVVVLPEGVSLPEEAEVEVRVPDGPISREEAFARILAIRIHRYVGMDEIIEEMKRERDEHWLGEEPPAS